MSRKKTTTPTGAAPTLLVRGQFSLYDAPDGGLHLALRVDGEQGDRHVPISPMMLRMMPGGKAALRELLPPVTAAESGA